MKFQRTKCLIWTQYSAQWRKTPVRNSVERQRHYEKLRKDNREREKKKRDSGLRNLDAHIFLCRNLLLSRQPSVSFLCRGWVEPPEDARSPAPNLNDSPASSGRNRSLKSPHPRPAPLVHVHVHLTKCTNQSQRCDAPSPHLHSHWDTVTLTLFKCKYLSFHAAGVSEREARLHPAAVAKSFRTPSKFDTLSSVYKTDFNF